MWQKVMVTFFIMHCAALTVGTQGKGRKERRSSEAKRLKDGLDEVKREMEGRRERRKGRHRRYEGIEVLRKEKIMRLEER